MSVYSSTVWCTHSQCADHHGIPRRRCSTCRRTQYCLPPCRQYKHRRGHLQCTSSQVRHSNYCEGIASTDPQRVCCRGGKLKRHVSWHRKGSRRALWPSRATNRRRCRGRGQALLTGVDRRKLALSACHGRADIVLRRVCEGRRNRPRGLCFWPPGRRSACPSSRPSGLFWWCCGTAGLRLRCQWWCRRQICPAVPPEQKRRQMDGIRSCCGRSSRTNYSSTLGLAGSTSYSCPYRTAASLGTCRGHRAGPRRHWRLQPQWLQHEQGRAARATLARQRGGRLRWRQQRVAYF